MRGRRKAALVVLGIALFVTVLSANAVVTLDRTAFDSEYAKESAEEAGLYASFADQFRSQITAQSSSETTENSPLDRSRSELLAAAITDEYVRSQGEQNIENVYAYLNGETDELRIGFDPDPVETRLLNAVESDVEDVDLTTIDMPFAEEIEAMASSRSEFEARRASFREEQKQRIQAETERELSDEELEMRLNDSMDRIRDRMLSELDSQLEGQFQGPQSGLADPVRDLQTARIDALTGEITYEEYTSRVETARDDLEDAFVDAFEAELDSQLPERVDATDQLGSQQRETLDTARTAISLSEPVAIGLAALSFVLAGLIAWLAPVSIAAIEVGVVSALVGAVGIAGSFVASEQLSAVFASGSGASGPMAEFARTLAVGVFEALTVQSAALLVVGAGLVAVGIAILYGYVDLDV